MHRGDFDFAVGGIANKLLFLNSTKSNEIIKLIYLREYFKEIARWALGPQKTAQLIKTCF